MRDYAAATTTWEEIPPKALSCEGAFWDTRFWETLQHLSYGNKVVIAKLGVAL